jgi:deoxyribodipyrimidine photo-lyase
MERVTRCNSSQVNGAGDFVLYWMTAYRRRHFNFALERAVFWATEMRKPLLILEGLSSNYRWASDRFHTFVIQGMQDNRRDFKDSPATYLPFVEQDEGAGRKILFGLSRRASVIVTDDFPAFEIPRWIQSVSSRAPVLMEKVDSNGVFPMRRSERLFLTASSFRRFLEKQPRPEMPVRDALADVDIPSLAQPEFLPVDCTAIPKRIDHRVAAVACTRGGVFAARERLQKFISSDSVSSGLSPYIHFGHISAHEVYQRTVESRRADSDRFLDELVTWRELGFNMCAYRSDYDQYSSVPQWAQKTLEKHASDPRPTLYSLEQLEAATTHDTLWNSAQMDLVTEGRIENRLRMLWGKKILEWSASPQDALAIMIHLNNKYALDGRDPNSYTGIFWILGRYDRPWGPERPIFGLVRYMSSQSTAKKLRSKQ